MTTVAEGTKRKEKKVNEHRNVHDIVLSGLSNPEGFFFFF